MLPCSQVDEVKGIMTENIDKMLQRGEKLELLEERTDNLVFEASGPFPRQPTWETELKISCALSKGQGQAPCPV